MNDLPDKRDYMIGFKATLPAHAVLNPDAIAGLSRVGWFVPSSQEPADDPATGKDNDQ